MKIPSLFCALAPAAAVILGSTALAQSFVVLPAGSGAATAGGGLSSNGRYATGSDANGAYLWDATNPGVVVSLGESQGKAVSDDGTRVLGKIFNPSTNNNEPGIWIQGTGWISCDPFAVSSTCSPNDVGSPYDMSNDGMVATGLGWIGCGARAFNYDANQVAPYAFLPQTTSSATRGNCVSGDGQWFGGWERVNGSTDTACIWKPDGMGGFTQIFPLVTGTDPDGFGGTWGFSTNGEWACGEGGFNGDEPWLYNTTTGQLTLLGSLPSMGFDDKAIAKAVSDDGQTVVGMYGGNGFFGSPRRAFRWTKQGGMQDLGVYLASLGLSLPPGSGPLYGAFDMSANGRVIYGALYGTIGSGDAWVATLPDPVADLGGSSAGTGGLHPVMTTTGTYNPGSSFSLYLDDAAGSAISVLLVSGTGISAPFLGGVLHTLPLDFTQVLLTSVTGEWDVTANWPPNMVSGVALTFQGAVFDPAAAGQFALSNGLKITTP